MNQEKQKRMEEQNNILAGIIDNESKTYTFKKEITINGVKKSGSFVAKYMGVSARLRIGTIRAKLLDGAPSQSIDVLTDDIAYMIAYLTVALVKVPEWWNFDDLEYIDDLRAVYLEVYNFIQSFRTNNDQNTDARDSSASTGKETVENQ